jgi:acyl-CoA thioester hydrolase
MPPQNSEQGEASRPAEETAATFEITLRVAEEDIDAMNHANNVVYLRWVQEAAAAHWNAAATEAQKAEYAWVVLRHEIDYLRPALAGEELTARTHVGEVSGARFERVVEIWRPADEKLLARARSVWCALDGRTGKPRRVSDELRQRFLLPPREA